MSVDLVWNRSSNHEVGYSASAIKFRSTCSSITEENFANVLQPHPPSWNGLFVFQVTFLNIVKFPDRTLVMEGS